ncbi:MAG TPA: VanZ family protein [Holophaga sp.]|nr:VanZ family protein [Holophaga sp.]
MRRTGYWVLPIAILTLSFWLSDRSGLPLGLELPHPLDWLAHGGAFAALGLSLEWAARNTWRGLPVYRRHLAIFLLVSLYGALDEVHQSFVPGRSPDVMDWAADTLGGGLGLVLSCLPLLWRRWMDTLGWARGRARRPDPARPLVLVADPHWSGGLTGLMEATAAHPEADWLFLGDVFDVWVGLPGMETPLQEAFLAWVDERRAKGRWVGLWLGNREYFLDRHAARFDFMGEGTGAGLEGEALAFEHGDLINTADRKYRLWNLVSRSGPMWLLASLLPRGTARALATRLERALATTNRAYKLAFPREAFREAAAEHSGQTFITGHFHTLEREDNGLALPWAHEGRFMVWQDGQVKPLSPFEHP